MQLIKLKEDEKTKRNQITIKGKKELQELVNKSNTAQTFYDHFKKSIGFKHAEETKYSTLCRKTLLER